MWIYYEKCKKKYTIKNEMCFHELNTAKENVPYLSSLQVYFC